MPFKHNAARRHRIPKARYRIQNWPAHEAGLKRRGDLTLWLDEDALIRWQAPRRGTPGGQAWYSDAAIKLVLMLRIVFHLALRQAEGIAASVLRLLGQTLRVPDRTTLNRRSRSVAGRQRKIVPHGPPQLLIDSTGVKLSGQGEWDEEKHGRTRRSWRKLHLAVDAGNGETDACLLTGNAADDASQLPLLLEAIKGEIASVTTDGAYDGEPVYQAIANHQLDPTPSVINPPRTLAVPSMENAEAPSQRDRHVRFMAEKGRMAWQRATDYGRRSLAETAVGRYKAIVGPKLRARFLPA
ncbi:MAG: Mobile element protein [uncultured Craurococcus sp.]|uniref:Mobile element protein n=1 Tax=uncultured Craurococcus sp. TaxID=1135998 RepID=A0A6J4JWH7_9PROT|nr:MAG: Mobile element protein [uncultured Craurococcus sp.]